MNVEQSAMILISTLLLMLAMIIFTIGIVIINNIVHKYWKSFGWYSGWFESKRYMLTEQEYQKIAPHLDPVEPYENGNNKKK